MKLYDLVKVTDENILHFAPAIRGKVGKVIELVEEIISTKRKGIQLHTHMSGAGVIEKIKEIQPDIVLLDLNLPEKHGKDILMEIKSDELIQEIPVIVISADAMPNQVSELKSLGAASYLTKPIEIKSFLDIVDSFIK